MKKILFVINTLGCGGAEKALIEMMKQFPQERYALDLYVLLDQGELIRQIPQGVWILNQTYSESSVLSREGKKELGKRVIRKAFQRGSLFRNFCYLTVQTIAMLKSGHLYPDKLLWKVMSDSCPPPTDEYDLAIAYLEGGSTYFVHDHVRAKRKVAFLHVDYGMAGYTPSLDRNCYEDFDQIYGVSDEVRASLCRAYPQCADKIGIFHNLIDAEEVSRKAKESAGYQDGFDGLRILTVGRLTSQKCYDIAIEAMAILKESGLRVRWYVLGEGELHEELQAQINRLGLTEDFLLLGVRENPYPYYANCDLYVHATGFEGKSIAIQEAQILGCAIIVSDTSGNREQVVNEEDGLMCELTPQAVAASIRRMAEEEGLRQKCKENAKKKYVMQKPEIEKMFHLD